MSIRTRPPLGVVGSGSSNSKVGLISAPVAGSYQVVSGKSNATDTGVNTMVKYTAPATGLQIVSLRLTNSGAATNGDVDGQRSRR